MSINITLIKTISVPTKTEIHRYEATYMNNIPTSFSSKISFYFWPRKFGVFCQIFAMNLKKMRFVRKTPQILEKVKIWCIYNFLGIANPKYMVSFLTVVLKLIFR